MQYLVLYIKTGNDGTVTTDINVYENRQLAEIQYYTTLATSVTSPLPKRAVVLMNNEGNIIMHSKYPY